MLSAQGAIVQAVASGVSLNEVLTLLAQAVEGISRSGKCIIEVATTVDAERRLVVTADGPVADHGYNPDAVVRSSPIRTASGETLGRVVLLYLPGSTPPTGDEDLPAWATGLATLAVVSAAEHDRIASSVALLAATLESTVDGILVVDQSGRIAGHNQTFAKMWRIDLELISSGDDNKVMAAMLKQLVDPAGFIAQVHWLYDSPEQTSFDELALLDGRIFEQRSQPQRVDDATVGRVWSFRDVTEKRRLQADLRDSQNNLRLLVGQVRDYAILNLDSTGHVISWNAGAQRIKGYTEQEILGQHFSVFYTEEDVAAGTPARGLEIALADGHALDEGWRVRKDGSLFWATVVITALYDADGRLHGFGKVTRDITDRHDAELALQSHATQLERLSNQLETVLNSAGEGIFGLDVNGTVTFINDAGARLIGLPRSKIVGRPAQDVIRTENEYGYVVDAEAPVSDGFKGTGTSRQVTGQHYRSDGTVFDSESISAPIIQDGAVVGSVVVFRDVSDRRAMERLKDQFISVVSHELRTPLTGIRGALGLLASGAAGPLPANAARMVEVGTHSADRLIRLITDILDLERMTAGHVTVQPRVADAGPLVAAAVEETAVLAASAQVSIMVGDTPGVVLADPDRLIQILCNLVGNAVKFSDPGSAVELSTTVLEEHVRFDVADHGPGIPADQLEEIFQPFWQADASDTRRHGGTGLGLAICRGIVEQHNGRIWASSEPEVGATFSFVLPRGDRLS
jgi:PAS domain S-box-containing protein